MGSGSPQAKLWCVEARQILKMSRAADPAPASVEQAAGPGTAPPVAAQTPAARTDAWIHARDAWRDANDTLNGHLSALRVAILDYAATQVDDADAMAEVADKGLNALTADHRVKLMASIMAVGEGTPALIQTHGPRALEMIAAFRSFLASSEKVAVCEDNPFGVPVPIRATLVPALDEVAAALQAAA